MEDDALVAPAKTDKLFSSRGENWQLNAILDRTSGDDYAYRMGYRRAGRILTEWTAANRETDFLVYPICHAYRHFVELSLKHLIPLACNVIEREITPKETALQTGTHSLRALWAVFKAIEEEASAKCGVAVNAENRHGIESYIEQFHEVDEGSFAFRYPLTRKGDVSLGELTHINLGTLSDHMEKLCDYLDGLHIAYSEFIQFRNEMHREVGGDIYG